VSPAQPLCPHTGPHQPADIRGDNTVAGQENKKLREEVICIIFIPELLMAKMVSF